MKKLDEEKIKQARNIYFWNTGEKIPYYDET